MPFETFPSAPRRIAVVGAGISGLAAAHLLAGTHRVVLFEAERRLGGHARTVLAGRRGDQPVDTGFIVFNRVNYPHLTALFDSLGVPVAPSDMSFAASIDGGQIEYGLRTVGTVIAQKRNLLRPGFLRMLRDIFRFNAGALAAARAGGEAMTVRELLAVLGAGAWFRDHYLLPLSGAIWSTPAQGILDFPARPLVEFFRNHALLGARGQHRWLTVRGGSVQYVARLEASLRRRGVDIRTGTPVAAVRRMPGGVELRPLGGVADIFDEVVLATHADVSRAMLADAAPEERAALACVRYQPNHAVLHADPAVMPRRRAVWSAWNYAEAAGSASGRINLTYWMNALQPIPMDDPLFVTLNGARPVREDLVHDQVTFRHPVYDAGTFRAQAAIRGFNGARGTWFCGAWMRNGFHEDGFASAVDVVEAMGRGALGRVAA